MEGINNYLAIMAGGVGSRFWPASRENMPKQFIDMLGLGKSLLQMTFERFQSLISEKNIFCVTNENYVHQVKSQLMNIPTGNIIGESSRNNTAPSVLLTTLIISKIDPKAVIGFVPSDHLILKEEQYRKICSEAFDFAHQNKGIVTLGIEPTRPDTGFGYINYDKNAKSGNVFKVKAFTEKPNLEKAESFLNTGEYLWNAGMFFSSVQTLLDEYRKFAPDILNILEPILDLNSEAERKTFIKLHYHKTPTLSIDFSIIEKSSEVYTIPSDIGWSDLGTWASLHEESTKDNNSNSILCQNILLDNVSNCLIKSKSDKLVVMRNVENMIVVDEVDVLMIYPMHKEQEIKQLGTVLKEKYNKHL